MFAVAEFLNHHFQFYLDRHVERKKSYIASKFSSMAKPTYRSIAFRDTLLSIQEGRLSPPSIV